MKIKNILPATIILAGLTFFGCDNTYFNTSFEGIIKSKDVFTRVERIENYLDKQEFPIKKKMCSIDDKTCEITYKNNKTRFNIKVVGFQNESKKDERWALVYIEGKDKNFDYTTFEKTVYSLLKGDFVKIHGAKFYLEESKENMDLEDGTLSQRIFKVELEGSDAEGINWFTYILDGKTLGITCPGEVEKNPYKLETIDVMFGVPITQEENSCWWEYKGKHNLKVIMEDNNGNKLDDTYQFEVK